MSQQEMLPGFAEAKARIEEKGYLSEWITKTVDPSEPGAVFLPRGKWPHKSDCPNYQGYWLCGHIGSVKCEACAELLPGLQWDIVCGKDYTRCKFYTETGYQSETD